MTLLAKMRRYLKKKVAVLIYKTMILPYLDYGDVIFHRSNSGDLNKLQRLQNRCLGICLGYDRRFSTDIAHTLALTPFLENRRMCMCLISCLLGKNQHHLLNTREIRTRAHDAPLVETKIPRCEAFKRSVGYSGSEMWNSLTPEMRNIDCFLLFKHTQKKRMLLPLDQISLED